MRKMLAILLGITLIMTLTGCYSNAALKVDQQASAEASSLSTEQSDLNKSEDNNLYEAKAIDSGINALIDENLKLDSENMERALIETDQYNLYLPETWNVTKLPGDFLIFEKDSKVIGSIEILGYYSDQPDSQLFSNHSELISSEELSGYSTKALKVRLTVSDSVATDDNGTVSKLHYYFLAADQNLAYDLSFLTSEIDDETAEMVAKSFQIK